MPSSARDEAATKPSLDTMSADERTLCEHPSDDEIYDGRPSSEVSDGDHDILESEDERERLLTQKEGITGMFNKKGVRIGKRERNTPGTVKAKERKRSSNGETSALMYEMEEGHGVSSSSLSRRSSESDERRLVATKTHRKTRRSRLWRRIFIYAGIVGLFLILLFAAYRVSKPAPPRTTVTMVSNGTSLFAPTTIMISLDGFRADFLYRGLTPTLSKFVAEGISPKYMLPSFPSVTFPNHFTMATGLYPEAHGVVGNTFWDPAQQKEFYYTDPERSMQPEWWGGEPIWRTAERQDVRVAVHMWPGSEAHFNEYLPAYVDKYNGTEALPRKVDRIMELLDTPGPEDIGALADKPRPQLIAAYVPNVDSDGHKFGPNSTEIRQTIKSADNMLGGILKGLQERNLTDIVNVVVVSDHGMATTDTSRLVQLEDLIDPAELEHIDGWPHFGLRPKKIGELERLHKQVVDRAQNISSIEVYLKDVDMPDRYHFSQSERIAPLWIIPKAGWAIVDKSEGDIEEMKKNGDVYHPRGIHGYDHEHPLMRAIFVARGPAFPHQPNSRMEPFQNIELYNIICDSIGIEPSANNGTLRLPLKPIGLHTDPDTPADETPADPVESPTPTPAVASPASPSPTSLASASASPSKAASPTTGAAPAESSPPAGESWWEWLTHKADNVEEWVDNFLHDHMPGGEDGDEKGEGTK
ncbi:Phosphodiest-domain-containing protein [Lentithecium fluviatile CBS 122367]|uniref:Phosphodiest-domain-containing protein n=1 Tax=Lentithecium fluviatile CBS 122367 TaxID=1168545 RepID=A0A6G1IV43_9PLEO|nr:Phosphodiest-domain-containing protein [Lentithecium fluviatile CBS 122367]